MVMPLASMQGNAIVLMKTSFQRPRHSPCSIASDNTMHRDKNRDEPEIRIWNYEPTVTDRRKVIMS
jgi:hypothetical protein